MFAFLIFKNNYIDEWSMFHLALRGQVTLGAFIVPVSPNPWQMKFAQCAASPSSLPRMRFSNCAVGPSSLLREHCPKRWGVPIVCSSPSSLTEPERWSLPSVQPAPHPWEMKFTSVQPAPHPSWEMRFIQCATSPSSLLRDEVYPACNQPLIPVRWSLKVCNQPLISPKDEVYLLIPSER